MVELVSGNVGQNRLLGQGHKLWLGLYLVISLGRFVRLVAELGYVGQKARDIH